MHDLDLWISVVVLGLKRVAAEYCVISEFWWKINYSHFCQPGRKERKRRKILVQSSTIWSVLNSKSCLILSSLWPNNLMVVSDLLQMEWSWKSTFLMNGLLRKIRNTLSPSRSYIWRFVFTLQSGCLFASYTVIIGSGHVYMFWIQKSISFRTCVIINIRLYKCSNSLVSVIWRRCLMKSKLTLFLNYFLQVLSDIRMAMAELMRWKTVILQFAKSTRFA
jgi:hypothetical protein